MKRPNKHIETLKKTKKLHNHTCHSCNKTAKIKFVKSFIFKIVWWLVWNCLIFLFYFCTFALEFLCAALNRQVLDSIPTPPLQKFWQLKMFVYVCPHQTSASLGINLSIFNELSYTWARSESNLIESQKGPG